jgi:hypothetical protein
MYSKAQLAMSGVDADCTSDWIQIPCATDQQSSSQLMSDGATACVNKLCGSYFNTATGKTVNIPVYSKRNVLLTIMPFITCAVAGYRKPFEVRVFTDAFNPTAASSIGFCLKYQQLACTSG